MRSIVFLLQGAEDEVKLADLGVQVLDCLVDGLGVEGVLVDLRLDDGVDGEVVVLAEVERVRGDGDVGRHGAECDEVTAGGNGPLTRCPVSVSA